MQKYNLFQNKYEKGFEQLEAQGAINKAVETFKPKGFVETYGKYYKPSKVVAYIAGGVSALLAFNFFVSLFAESLGTYTGLILSVLCVAGIEVIKSALASEVFKGLVSSRFATGGAVALAVVLVASVYTSLQGAKDYVNTTGAAKLETVKAGVNDSLNNAKAAHLALLNEAKAEMKEYKKSVSYKGKLNTSDKKVMGILESKQKQIDNLQSEFQALQTGISDAGKGLESTTIEATTGAAFKMVCIAVANEIIILGCIFFGFWFLAGAYKEAYHNGKVKDTNDTDNDMRNDTSNGNNNAPQYTPNPYQVPNQNSNKKRSIGFHFTPSNDNRNNAHRLNDTDTDNDTDNDTGAPNDNRNEMPQNTHTKELVQYTRFCKHCGGGFIHNAPRHIFCSESCRVASWEAVNGKTFKRKPKA